MSDEPELVQLLTTLGEKDSALRLARAVVEGGHAACVQVVGPIASVYRWEGAVQEEEEYLCIMKVPPERLEALTAFIGDRHPYEVPELTALPCSFADPRYLSWVRESVT